MITFIIIFGVGLLGMISLVVVRKYQMTDTSPSGSLWYLIDWKKNYQLMTTSMQHRSKQVLLDGVLLLVYVYRKVSQTSAKSAKRAVRRILFPHNHVSRTDRPTSTF
ncbi:MAG: hypothetical protein OEX08_00835 [Candidatus Nomurabacteria bacterium]|nr:hypothetical protein [Candidatus Nomurabacteria bacterium]